MRRARRRPAADHRQRLHPVPADARRQGAVHGRGPEGRQRAASGAGDALHPAGGRAAPGAAGDGRVRRLAVRLLHAGLRDVALGHLPAPRRPRHAGRPGSSSPTSSPATSAAAPATGRSSTPASACSTCRRRRSTPRRRAPRCESLRSAETFRYAAGGAELVAPKTLEAFAAERLARPDARILAGSTDIGLWVNKMFRAAAVAALHRRRRRAEAHRARRRRALDRRRRLARGRLARPGRALADAGRHVAALRRRCRCAMPARWAATSPTARRSATARRC